MPKSTISHPTLLFETIFRFLKNGIDATAENNPYNQEIIAERDWLEEHYEQLEECFLAADTFVNFGFLIVTAALITAPPLSTQ